MMDSPEIKPQPEEAISASSTPRKHIDSKPLPTDSLVTIPLSDAERTRPPTISGDGTTVDETASVDSAIEEKSSSRGSLELYEEENDRKSVEAGQASLADELQVGEESTPPEIALSGDRVRSDSASSHGSIQVDWEQLDKTEAAEDADTESDKQTTLLLARLEQENQALATDPKSAALKARIRSQSRPPSIHQLKKLVQEQGARSVRFSLLPAAAPMTELDFWAALVRDYSQTAQRLPTVTSNKIRGGIPAPLRGVVWVSMAGARNVSIEDEYDRLCGESSPYENIISKDIGRSFPGVEMFRDPAGEGQKMLGRVLKCFSLYDDKIGYCQGLGFLVGPLLMNMGDKQAFCVLVRLMEDYDLRSCFLPDLSGLHLRIYQFQRLLHQHVPKVAAQLEYLSVEGSYLSQWFLSLFAVTCPLHLLFRIYDVIFAEGASETIMRVALAVMQRNEKKLLSFTELEEVMQLLLSRQLWDPYGLSATSADELVGDFVAFTSVVTRERLTSLEADFRKAQSGESGGKGSFFPDVQAAASRFLGRLWTSSHSHTASKSTILSPGLAAPSRPGSTLLRTPSKQSLATLSSIEGSSEGSVGTASTALTEMSRESSADYASLKSLKSPDSARITISSKDKDLHSQIEDLLTALSELQREHSLLATQLQKEREERIEDHNAIRPLVNQLKENIAAEFEKETVQRAVSESAATLNEGSSDRILSDITALVDKVDNRMFSTQNRRSSGYESKAQLRLSLANTKEQLRIESSRSQQLSRILSEKEQENTSVREELRKARVQIRDAHMEKQRLDKVILDLRQAKRQNRSRSGSQGSAVDTMSPPSRSDTGQSEVSTNSSGLREFRLMRTLSNRSDLNVQNAQNAQNAQPTQPQTFSKRSSSLNTQAILATDNHAPPSEDALLLELVNAKTAEAVAKQELEELRARFEAMRKMLNLSTLSGPPSPSETITLSKQASRISEAVPMPVPITKSPDSAKQNTPASGSWTGGGFFGWGKRTPSQAQVPTIMAETR